MEVSATVGQRFSQLISHLGISKNAFAASLDKTATVIQHLVDERNKPGFDLLCKVFEIYPNVSKEWLLQGLGPMLYTNQQTSSPNAGHQINKEREGIVASEIAAPLSVVEPALSTTEPPAPKPEQPSQAPPLPATEHQAPAPSSAAPFGPVAPDTSWQTALYTQQMAHQLAMAELRNQHMQEQQRLMQQMMDLMQRQLSR